MSQKKILLRSALSCDVEDGLLDMDQIMGIAQNPSPWEEIDNFVQCNFMQEYTKKRTARSPREKKEESSAEKAQSNSKATGGKPRGKAEKTMKQKSVKEKSMKEKTKEQKEKKRDKDVKKGEGASSCKKGARKSAKDQKSQGNSSEAKVNSTVKRSGDRASIGSKMAETMQETMQETVQETMEMEGTKESVPSQDTNVFSFEPIEESTRIDYSCDYDGESVKTSMSNGNHGVPCSNAFNATIPNGVQEEKNGGRKSLNSSKGECARKARHSVKKIAEEHGSDNREEFVEKMKKKRQSLGKSRCSNKKNAEMIVEKGISLGCSNNECSRHETNPEKQISENREEFVDKVQTQRQSLGKSKCSEKGDAEKILEEDISNNNFDGKEKVKRKSINCSKKQCSRKETNVEKQISENREEFVEKARTQRQSLGKSKCSEKENAENIAENNISSNYENFDGKAKEKRKSMNCSKNECSRKETEKFVEKVQTQKKENADNIAENNIPSNYENFEEKAKGKRMSSSCSRDECSRKKETNAEKQILDNHECLGDERKEKRRSLGKSKCLAEERNVEKPVERMTSQDREKFDAEKKEKMRSPGRVKCSKGEKNRAEKAMKKQISDDRKVFDEGKKAGGKSLGSSNCAKKEKWRPEENERKTKKWREPKASEQQDDISAAIKGEKLGRFERLLLSKQKRREERRIRRHEREAGRAMEKFGKHVTKIVKSMGYNIDVDMGSNTASDDSDDCSCCSSHSSSCSGSDSSSCSYSDSSSCSYSDSSCSCSSDSCSCSYSYSCFTNSSSSSDFYSCTFSKDSSREYSEYSPCSD
nr:zinc finger CCCH domain-containing protein 13-like isoform X2 [Megalopta genalis]